MSMEITYLDFAVTIKKVGELDYVVIAKSGHATAETRFDNPFNEDKVNIINAIFSQRGLRTLRSRDSDMRRIKAVGTHLFEQTISGPVRELYHRSLDMANREGKGLRLRLQVDASLSILPWEFLCSGGDFVALNPRNPVVRYIEGATANSLVKVEYPLRVLVVIASPEDSMPLDTQAEKNSITAALTPLVEQGLAHLTFVEGFDTWGKLSDALLPNRTHILHFIGHGEFDEEKGEGVLVMADADGKTMLVDSERLSVLVQGRSRLALVFLNSAFGVVGGAGQPFSSVAAGLVKSGLPAVIAMQNEISDVAAREIAETFYTSLALNMPVDTALTEARRKIFLLDRNSLEWAAPILYMQTPDGRLFEFIKRGEAEQRHVKESPTPQKENYPPTIKGRHKDRPVQKQTIEKSTGDLKRGDLFERVEDRLQQAPSKEEEVSRPEPAAKPARAAKSKIFISYRRTDTEGFARSIVDKLGERFGEDQVFMDLDMIEPGEDFVEVIEKAVGECAILIAIIGKGWLATTDDTGSRRLDAPEDSVRVEISTALARKIRVVPVLVQGATMPQAKDLPDVLASLARRNALELSTGRWKHDIGRLIQAVEKVLTV